MHTYLARTRTDGTPEWAVGLMNPTGAFRTMKVFAGEAEAAAYASYLNGGPLPATPAAQVEISGPMLGDVP